MTLIDNIELKIGQTFRHLGHVVTITRKATNKVYFAGTGIGGSASQKYFRSTSTAITNIPTEPDVPCIKPPTIKTKTLSITNIPTESKLPEIVKDLTKKGQTKLIVILIIILYILFTIFRKVIKL